MAIIVLPRTGLTQYTSPADPRPGRAEHNTERQLINDLFTIGGQGTEATRPTAGAGRGLYWNTTRNVLQWDRGDSWQDISTVGGGGTPQAVVVAGTGTEGTNSRGARADHTHNLPLATVTAHGAMSKTDKDKLDRATHYLQNGTLVQRDSAGRANFASPVDSANAATKGYVDQVVGGAAAPVVTSAYNGLATPSILAAAETVDAATPAAIRNKLVMRDENGRAQVVTPASATDVANKTYVDSQIATHRHDGAHITTGTVPAARLPRATTTTQGVMSAADKTLLSEATTGATGSTLVRRATDGRTQVADPIYLADAVTKRYVDAEDAKKANVSHTHTGSDITSGTVSVSVLPVASTTSSGIVTSTVFNKVSDATTTVVKNTLVERDDNGNIQVQNPRIGLHAATKYYVDSTSASKSHTHDAADITAGTLPLAALPVATRTTHGAISAADQRLIDDATYEPTGNTLVKRYENGSFRVETGTNPKDAANKGYVDSAVPAYSQSSTTGSTLIQRFPDGQGGYVADPISAYSIANKRYVDGKTWNGSAITSGYIPHARISGSKPAYDRIQTGTHYTVSVNASGDLARFSSTRRHKTNIRPWDKDPRTLLKITPSIYDRIDPITGKVTLHGQVGVIAEHAEAAGVTEFVQYGPDTTDDEGNPQGPTRVQGWDYMLWTAAQQHLHRWQAERVDELIQRVTDLENARKD